MNSERVRYMTGKSNIKEMDRKKKTPVI